MSNVCVPEQLTRKSRRNQTLRAATLVTCHAFESLAVPTYLQSGYTTAAIALKIDQPVLMSGESRGDWDSRAFKLMASRETSMRHSLAGALGTVNTCQGRSISLFS